MQLKKKSLKEIECVALSVKNKRTCTFIMSGFDLKLIEQLVETQLKNEWQFVVRIICWCIDVKVEQELDRNVLIICKICINNLHY